MKSLITKVMASIFAMSLLCLVACNSNADTQTEPVTDESKQQSENFSEPESVATSGSNTEDSLLTGTYKVAKKDIYVDIPGFNVIESGYTRIYVDGYDTYVTFTCIKEDAPADLEGVQAMTLEVFKRNVLAQHQIEEITDIQTIATTINSIDTLRFEGTCNAGYDAYICGYSFVYEGLPCAIIGAVRDNQQLDSEKQQVELLVDEMMKTVRNSR